MKSHVRNSLPLRRPRGFTLVELLVVIAIISILVGMAIPAIQGMREASRRTSCVQNLNRISLALSEYSLTFETMPAGSINPTGPIRSEPVGFHHNWAEGVLPYMDYAAVYQAIDQDVSIYAEANQEPLSVAVPLFRCPSAHDIDPSTSCYAGLHHPLEAPIAEDNLGMFILNRQLGEHDVPDGLSSTLLVSEKVEALPSDLGWLSGTRATLRNTGHPIRSGISAHDRSLVPVDQPELYVGGLASDHPSGVNGLMGDGSIRMLATTSDLLVLQQLADRRDGTITARPAADVEEDGE